MNNNPHDIVPAHLAVQAMRDNGYKNAAYAIAELMDNAIQAGASQVELLCGQRMKQLTSRKSSHIEQIAVLDNGCGMDAMVLRLALQFGNGTHLEKDQHTGIGRFGMGLPSSSVSQCKRVDVWSWQNGVESALYTYLDLDEIKTRQLNEVPQPIPKSVPHTWLKVGQSFGYSGTLVVWSKIDRCMWRTGKTIIDHSELLIGRMYRKFLDNDKVTIRMYAFDLDSYEQILERYALPNDPLYLMSKTSCPPPFDNQPMFQLWQGDNNEETTFIINFEGKDHEVKVRFAYAKEEARKTENGKQPGALPHGKHAAKNVGISVVRAGRELELDQTLVNTYDPTERWWGVEVDFPPALDDIFGVTNNKQSARNFGEVLALDIESLLENGKTVAQLKEELKEDQDPKLPLIDLAEKINSQLTVIRGLIKTQTRGDRTSSSQRHQSYKPQKTATFITKERQSNGYKGESDKDEQLPKEERKQAIQETLIEEGITPTQAELLAATTVDDGLKYTFVEASLDTPAFFSVKPKGGAIIVTLNTRHPAYKNLVEVLEENIEDADIDTLRTRLTNSLDALKLLLMAWARYEDEQPEGIRKNNAQEARVDWGRLARRFLENEE
ncbi:ATP-binding protein [Cyanobacterium aponinum FACHB-4101]|uniref:ATP-binding protein n=1 Tax=Cyanobacterium aponinum TaxID=379064 RepID=UPI001680E84D|nr:ATP-binding protein [Cyanobacterium aponinum]MBD2392767.1 ATP-binding protein [Cyanobacterium aponinum FACHB-4101]